MKDNMLSRYKKADNSTKVLLIYLILNNYDLSKITVVEEDYQKRGQGAEYKKIFGLTSEFVDVVRIENELKEIEIPMVCSPVSYEIYENSPVIYSYKNKEAENPLYINDMSIISPYMVIEEDYIISSNVAKSVENADRKGFMFFVDYIIKGECDIGYWKISYDKQKEFRIMYLDKDNEDKGYQVLYTAKELDKSATFKLVLYIIRKVADTLDEIQPDNYEMETWRRKNE